MAAATFHERFDRAYQSTLRKMGVHGRAAGIAPEELGRRVALLVATKARWEDQLGPSMSSTGLQHATGLSRQALAQAVHAHRVLRLTTKDGRTRYPAFQLGRDGKPRSWLRQVLREFAGAAVNGWTVASWLTSPQPELVGRSPLEFVDAGGDVGAVVTLARRRAARLAR